VPSLEYVYLPSKRKGFLFIISTSVFLVIVSIFLLVKANQAEVQSTSLLLRVAVLISSGLLIWLLYESFVLMTMKYTLLREKLVLQWGFRREEIPANLIEWVKPASQLNDSLQVPLMHIPGLIANYQRIHGVNAIDYAATEIENLVLVATPTQVYVISPIEINAFLDQFHRMNELGSLEQVNAKSVRFSTFWARIWQDRIARLLILLSFLLVLALFAFVLTTSYGRSSIIWEGEESVPSTRLLLLPFMNFVLWLLAFVTGSTFFLRQTVPVLTVYILWGFSILTSLFMGLAVLLMVY